MRTHERALENPPKNAMTRPNETPRVEAPKKSLSIRLDWEEDNEGTATSDPSIIHGSDWACGV